MATASLAPAPPVLSPVEGFCFPWGHVGTRPQAVFSRVGSEVSGHGPFGQAASCPPWGQYGDLHRPWGCLEPTASKASGWSPREQWSSFRETRTSTVRAEDTGDQRLPTGKGFGDPRW